MAKFKYRALTSTNEKVEGVYEAKSKDEVLAIISSNGYYPLMIEEVIESTNINLGLKKLSSRILRYFAVRFIRWLMPGFRLITV
ncbi:MAG: hypothetical protein ACLVLR_05010 [Turicibacter sanguinis]